MTRLGAAVLVMGAISVALFACDWLASSDKTGTSNAVDGSTALKKDGVGSDLRRQEKDLRIVVPAPPLTLDPTKIVEVNSINFAAIVHSPLAYIDQNEAISPLLAKHISMAQDGLSCRIEVRDGARFWDGQSVGARDVVRSLKLLRTSRHPHRWILDYIQGIEAFDKKQEDDISGLLIEDTRHLTIRFSQPDPDFVRFISSTAFMIVRPPNEDSVQKRAYDVQVIGAGPFRLEQTNPGRSFTFVRSNEYEGFREAPKKLRVDVIGSPPNRLDEFLNKRAHMVRLRGPLISEALTSQSKGITWISAPANELVFLSINWSSKALRHLTADERKTFSKCLSHSLDREALVKTRYHGYAAPASMMVSARSASEGRVQESTRATCPRMKGLTLLSADDPDSRGLAKYIARQSSSAGIGLQAIQVQLGQVVVRALSDDPKKKAYDVLLLWVENQIPSAIAPWLHLFRQDGFFSSLGEVLAGVEASFDEARSTVDSTERRKKYQELATRISNAQVGLIPVVSRHAVYLTRELFFELDYNGSPPAYSTLRYKR